MSKTAVVDALGKHDPSKLREVLERRPELEELRLDGRDGTTPLHAALKKEYPEAFELLLRHGADPDTPGRNGRTVREIAARKRDRSYGEMLEEIAPRR